MRLRRAPPTAPAPTSFPAPRRLALGLERGAGAAGHELVGRVQRIEGSGVRPPAVEPVETERALAEVVIVHVGDLQLAAGAGTQGPDDVEYLGVVEVDADHRQIAGRLPPLLDDEGDGVARGDRAPIALRVVHLLEHEPGPAALLGKRAHARSDRALEDVV